MKSRTILETELKTGMEEREAEVANNSIQISPL
jgi:hypothetical protein